MIGTQENYGAPTSDERELLLAKAEELLRWARGEGFLEGGPVPGSITQGGASGPRHLPGSEYWYDRRSVVVYRPCAREIAASSAWHDYCAEHGYPRGRDDLTGYPPRPERGGGAWVGLTWRAIRRELVARRAGGEQLALFEPGAR